MDWTPITMIATALLMVAELLVFRTVTDSRIVNGLTWVLAAALFLFGFVWIAY